MILFLAHSMTLKAEALALKERLSAAGHTVQMPCDPVGHTEYRIHTWNAALIKQAEAVLALWDGSSDGCPMDVAMAIALGRKVYVDFRNAQPTTPAVRLRAWTLFSELPTIKGWFDENASK